MHAQLARRKAEVEGGSHSYSKRLYDILSTLCSCFLPRNALNFFERRKLTRSPPFSSSLDRRSMAKGARYGRCWRRSCTSRERRGSRGASSDGGLSWLFGSRGSSPKRGKQDGEYSQVDV